MIYWVDVDGRARIGIAPRPRGGDWLETELATYRRDGVDLLVSLLTDPEQAELGLSDEAASCASAGLEFRRYPIPDRETPDSVERFRTFIDGLHGQLTQGRSIAAHCRAGIGRSSIVVASLLCRQGYSADEAFQRISAARGMRVPDTKEQVNWVEQFSAST